MLKTISVTIAIFFSTMFTLTTLANDTTENKIQKEFTGITFIELATVSGSCKVIQHNKNTIIVSVEYDYKPVENFEPVFEQQGSKLKLKENMSGENSGWSNWTIMAPDSLEFKFASVSGAFSVKDITGKFEVGTVSGNITADRTIITGQSGFGTVSGNVMVSDIRFFGHTGFGTVSGNIEVSLAQSPAYNLDAHTASGNATIDFQNNSVTGMIQMRAKFNMGEIICPHKFDTEEVVGNEEKYMLKKVKLGSDKPVITIHTVSGKAIMKK